MKLAMKLMTSMKRNQMEHWAMSRMRKATKPTSIA